MGPRAGKSHPHRDSIPDLPACSQSLYRLSYRAHNLTIIENEYCIIYYILVFLKNEGEETLLVDQVVDGEAC